MNSTATPAMRQYQEIKSKYPDAILFYRMGDFYEMFYEDAKIASKILDIALTSRNPNSDNPVPMCGIPFHALDSYLSKIIKTGKKVALCEQMEKPGETKGIVRREVVRVVTPGTVLSPSMIKENESSFICSLFPGQSSIGCAVIDLSTSDFRIGEFKSIGELKNELIKIEPREILLPKNKKENGILTGFSLDIYVPITDCEPWTFEEEFAKRLLLEQLKTSSLDGFGCGGLVNAVNAAGALVHYLKETQKTNLQHIRTLKIINTANHMNLDVTTIRNLELVRRSDGEKTGTLLSLIDSTLTPMGARMLKEWILKPLIDISMIKARQEAVNEFYLSGIKRSRVGEELKKIRDLERLSGRLTLSAVGPRDIITLKNSIEPLPMLEKIIRELKPLRLKKIVEHWDNLDDIRELIKHNISETPPMTLREEGIIRDGVDSALDELRSIKREGKQWITQLEKKERERTGISTLKIKFNNVFGYFIEVSKRESLNMPSDYIRKQTLVNAERYISPDLKEYEEKVLGAEEKIKEIEGRIFEEVRIKLTAETERIILMGELVGEIDVILSLSETAVRNNYIMPEITDDDVMSIQGGRHPVIEKFDNNERFVPNDTLLNATNSRIMIITGPNMAGKSTYLRQVALIALMAQTGGFVPAETCRIGIIDRIFTRVGAQDFLHKGQSTFMVEMNETANILNNATSKSLIILDEIGRGTSTFDGISIAWSVVEYLHDKIMAKTLFATHYHELTELSLSMDKIVNYNVAVREWNEELIFLRKIVEGGADKSYGIQVARLAGIPPSVINRSKEILSNLENKEFDENGSPRLAGKKGLKKELSQPLLPLFATDYSGLQSNMRSEKQERGDETVETQNFVSLLKEMDIDNLTPVGALLKLNELKKMVK